MEILLVMAAVLSLLGFILKSSFYPRWGAFAASLILAAFIMAAVPWLTRQSSSSFSTWSLNPDLILNGAVCIVVEVIIMTAFCYGRTAGRLRLLYYYPGLLAFPAAAWLLSQLLFSRPGIDFKRFAWIAAVSVMILSLGGGRLAKRFIPEEDVRLESLFLIEMFLLLLAIAAAGAITF